MKTIRGYTTADAVLDKLTFASAASTSVKCTSPGARLRQKRFVGLRLAGATATARKCFISLMTLFRKRVGPDLETRGDRPAAPASFVMPYNTGLNR